MSSIHKERVLHIGVFGCGSMGQFVIQALKNLTPEKDRMCLDAVVVGDMTKERNFKFDRLSSNPDDIFKNPRIDTVVELIGGVGIAKDYLYEIINRGKHAVTANKSVIGLEANGLFAAARLRDVFLGIGATVGGAVPVIENILRLREDGDGVTGITAIINGTCNYIVTRMTEDGWEFRRALSSAQEKHYAEPDPTRDINGNDSADKLGVLATLSCNAAIDLSRIPCRGINDITPADIIVASKNGYVIKLLAIADIKRAETGVTSDKDEYAIGLQVTPALVNLKNPLTLTRDAYNMMLVQAGLAGNLIFYGKGAGPETASSILSDLRLIRDGRPYKLPTLDSKVKYVEPAAREKLFTRGTDNPFFLPIID